MFRTQSGTEETVISNERKLYILNQDWSLKHYYPVSSNRSNYFMPGFYPDTYLAFLERGGGLEEYDFRSGEEVPKITHHLSGRSLSSGMRDKRGGFWVTSLDAGIFYCPYPKQLIYRKGDDAKNEKAISIALTGPGDFYAGYDDGGFYHFNEETSLLRQVEEEELVIPDRLFDL